MKTFAFALLAGALALPAATLAQTAPVGVDPACMMKDASGKDVVDMTKCPDGKTASTAGQTTTGTAQTGTASTAPASTGVLIAPESFSNTKIMSANDFIGKQVYTKANEDIGEVNDLIVSDNGNVRAVILGVGGFLGMGEKNVAVSMASIKQMQDGNSMRLVIDANKEQLNAAPTYDVKNRRYMK